MTTIRTFINSVRTLATSPRALAILAILYALLLATVYGFIATRVATVWQVTLTFVFLVLIPIEFFVLQAAILQRARAQKFHWAQILRDAIKLAVMTIPIVLLGFGIAYLLNKWQAHYPEPLAPPVIFPPAAVAPPQPPHCPPVLLATCS